MPPDRLSHLSVTVQGVVPTPYQRAQFLGSTSIASYLAYYNNERRHSALDYLSPHHFETLNQYPKSLLSGYKSNRLNWLPESAKSSWESIG